MKNKITGGTITRTIILIVTMLNLILNYLGKNPLPFSNDEIYEGISAIAAVISATMAWWKNNSFTENAIKADKVLKNLNERDK